MATRKSAHARPSAHREKGQVHGHEGSTDRAKGGAPQVCRATESRSTQVCGAPESRGPRNCGSQDLPRSSARMAAGRLARAHALHDRERCGREPQVLRRGIRLQSHRSGHAKRCRGGHARRHASR
jgi:hypothetical protein